MQKKMGSIFLLWFNNFVIPVCITMAVILSFSYTINKLNAPTVPDPILTAKKEAKKETRTIDTNKLVYDKSLANLMNGIQKKNFEYLVVSRENVFGEHSRMVLYFSIKGEDKVHHLVLPVSTYNNIELNYLFPQKIDFEIADAAFLEKNEVVVNTANAKELEIDWGREIFVTFGIGCCVACIWMMMAPLYRRKVENPEPINNINTELGGRAIHPSKIQGGMDDLIGLEDIKAEVLQIEDMIKNRAKYKAHGIEKPFNILMSGPAGTGKTKMASYLAKALNIPMFSQPAGALETGLIGGGSATLNTVYNEARKHPMSLVFLDEGQVLLAKRGQDALRKNADDTANTLLSILDGTNTVDQHQVITIVASNFNDNSIEMDEAMLRRFPIKIDFRLPNLEERREILSFYLGKKEDGCVDWENTNLNYIADITAGMSPALLNTLTDKASLIAIQEDRLINTDILFRAFERCSVGLTDRAKTAGRDLERRRIAIHEFGHFFMQIQPMLNDKMSWSEIKQKSKFLKISTEAVAKVNALGYVLSSQDEIALKTLTELENQIIELYGGAAAEEVFYGASNISIGSHNDFEKVTNILDTMINKLSMYEKSKINYSMLKGSNSNNIEKIENVAERLYGNSLEYVKQHKLIIEKLTELLLDKYVMNKDELFNWLEENYTV